MDDKKREITLYERISTILVVFVVFIATPYAMFKTLNIQRHEVNEVQKDLTGISFNNERSLLSNIQNSYVVDLEDGTVILYPLETTFHKSDSDTSSINMRYMEDKHGKNEQILSDIYLNKDDMRAISKSYAKVYNDTLPVNSKEEDTK